GLHAVPTGEVQLLKVQLALSGVNDYGDPAELLEAIDSRELNDADRSYLSGLRAESSPVALEHFIRATELDSHHNAARKMAGILALSLADFERAENIAVVSRQLFNDDADFLLIEALAHAGRGNTENAVRLIHTAITDQPDRDAWLQLADFLTALREDHHSGGERVFHVHLSADDSELNFHGLLDLIGQFRSRFLPQLRRRNWYLPPQVESALDGFVLAANQDGRNSDAVVTPPSAVDTERDLMQRGLTIIHAHPEGTLCTVIARHLLDLGVGSTADRQSIQIFFETAWHARSFAADVRQHALLGRFAVSARLLLIDQVEPEANLQRIGEVMDLLDPAEVNEVNTARVMTLLSLKYEDWKRAERYSPRWIELAQTTGTEDMLVSALWNAAVIHEHNREWKRLAETCDEIIRLAPDPNSREAVVAPESLRETAAVELTNALTSRDLLHWGRMFEIAIDQKQISLAAAALAQLKQQATGDPSYQEKCERELEQLLRAGE
ncbi:MAG: hypothetical protein KDA85_02630, partial [Planctomycetaceae bacterium]|nr:hypothetical protein [Planctomycetaceae bacterium]